MDNIFRKQYVCALVVWEKLFLIYQNYVHLKIMHYEIDIFKFTLGCNSRKTVFMNAQLGENAHNSEKKHTQKTKNHIS